MRLDSLRCLGNEQRPAWFCTHARNRKDTNAMMGCGWIVFSLFLFGLAIRRCVWEAGGEGLHSIGVGGVGFFCSFFLGKRGER